MASVANLLQGSVTFLHCLCAGHFLESDLALLLKVLVANLFLSRLELSHIRVVALFDLLVGALQYRVLFERLDCGLLENAAHAVILGLTSGKVDAAYQSKFSIIIAVV